MDKMNVFKTISTGLLIELSGKSTTIEFYDKYQDT